MDNEKILRLSFQEAVAATKDVEAGFRPGLQALGANSVVVRVQDKREISGSVDIDAITKSLYPRDSRWDYVIGYKGNAYFVEVHPADTKNVKEVILKKIWLEDWLKKRAPKLKEIKAVNTPYYWVPSGRVAILKNSPQYKRIALSHIQIVKVLEL